MLGVDGELAVVFEIVGADPAHTVRGGSAKRGEEDMTSLVFGVIIEVGPKSDAKHVILALLNLNVDDSRLSIGSAHSKNVTFRRFGEL